MAPSMIQTKEFFAGPVEMRIVVRLPANDIRLAGPSGSSAIFNWGDNPQELRLHRPDGNTKDEKLGSLMKAPTQPLKFNTWCGPSSNLLLTAKKGIASSDGCLLVGTVTLWFARADSLSGAMDRPNPPLHL